MRTVQVGDDHVAEYEKFSKGVYLYQVRHVATNRVILADLRCDAPADAEGQLSDIAQWRTARAIASSAADALRYRDRKRENASTAFAAGKPVPNTPGMPPEQQRQAAAGELEIGAALPVKMIRDAYNAKVLTIDPKARERAALEIGRSILIGATDAQILKIARGEATLSGSLRTGVAYTENV